MEYGDINQDEIDAIAEYAYEIAETAASEFLEIRPVGVEILVEEGSIDTIVIIGAYASALFTAISGYGGFLDGLFRIKEQARLAGKFVCNQILKRSRAKGTSRVTTGHLTQLHRLFHRVESGELTADEAIEKSLRIFVKAGEEVSQQLLGRIKEEFSGIEAASSEKGASRVFSRLIEYHPTTEQRKTMAAKRVRRRGVEIRRNPGESERNKRNF